MSDFNSIISKTRWKLMQDPAAVFFASLAFQLDHRIDNSIPTACTNGLRILYNENFLNSISAKQRVGLMLHEILHVAFMHTHQFPFDLETATERQLKLWNVACDYVINLIIIDSGFELPPGGWLDQKYRDMSATAVFNKLMSQSAQQDPTPMDEMQLGGGAGGTPEQGDEPGNNPGSSPNTSKATTREVEIILNAAKQQAIAAGPKAVGNIPGEILRAMENKAVPKVPWHILMRRFYNSNVARKLNFRKLNRRFLPKIKLPTKDSKGIKKAVTIFDVSGSISEAELQKCAAESVRMLQIPEIKTIEAYQFDTEIKGEPSILKNQADVVDFKLLGGGGTSMHWLPEWCRENRPDFVIIFTDGYFSPIQERINVPILWVIFDNLDFRACEQGKVVYYDKD